MMKIQNTVALAVLLVGAVQSMQAAYQVGLGSDRFIGPKSADFKGLPLQVAHISFECLGNRSDWGSVLVRENEIVYKYSDFYLAFDLPFKYRSLSEQDLFCTYYGFQNNAFVIEENECAIVGPLCPCVGIFVTLTDLSKTLVMHVDQTVSLEKALDTILSFVGDASNDQVRVAFCTNCDSAAAVESQESILKINSPILGLNKVSIVNIQKNVWSSEAKDICFEKDFFPPYYTAAINVFVTSAGELFSTCCSTEVVKCVVKKEDKFFKNESFYTCGIHTFKNIIDFADKEFYQKNTFSNVKMLCKDFALQCNQAADDTK